MAMVRAFVKEPGKPAKATFISDDLRVYQKLVGGYIEPVVYHWDGYDFVVLCDEEGGLKGKPHNMTLDGISFVGTLVFVGEAGDHWTHFALSMGQFEQMLEELGE